jgi:hypothetical protein
VDRKGGAAPPGEAQPGLASRPAIGGDSLQRALIGFLLAAALALVEAGYGEIVLADNQACLQRLRGIRLAPPPTVACASEFTLNLAESLSGGVLGVLSEGAPRAVGWILSAALYGLAGAGFAQLKPRQAAIGFLIVHAALVMVFVAVNYLSQFIVV